MRLIDADAYIKYCEESWIPLNVDAVKAQPTVDVVEREKGKWMAQKGGGYRCSECKHYALDEREGNLIHVSAKTKFCPHCGADMREEKTDENLHRNRRRVF